MGSFIDALVDKTPKFIWGQITGEKKSAAKFALEKTPTANGPGGSEVGSGSVVMVTRSPSKSGDGSRYWHPRDVQEAPPHLEPALDSSGILLCAFGNVSPEPFPCGRDYLTYASDEVCSDCGGCPTGGTRGNTTSLATSSSLAARTMCLGLVVALCMRIGLCTKTGFWWGSHSARTVV